MQTVADATGSNELVSNTDAAASEIPLVGQPRRRVEALRVAIVDNLLRSEEDLSRVAWRTPGFDARAVLKRDRYISSLALANIENNVKNLIENPETKIFHLSEVSEASMAEYNPDAVVLSGTLRDFDLYSPAMLERFHTWVRKTSVPVLGICGGHQLVGMSFGAKVITLDHKEPAERRENRINEYQYRFVKIVADDPIFDRIDDRVDGESSPHVRGRQRVLRVWQNHGLMVDEVPEGFSLLAVGYMCPIQMMVKRTDEQLIYTVQFHIEKSFEDWGRPKSFWDHTIESRDGRVIFENFLVEAEKHRDRLSEPKAEQVAGAAQELTLQ